MKPSNLKLRRIYKKKSESKSKLNTIEIESNLKFRNELFQKLFENNNNISYKERINSHGNLYSPKKRTHLSPEIHKNSYKYIYKNRNPSYLYGPPKNKRMLKISNSKVKNNTLNNTNSNSAKIIKSNKFTKLNNSNSRKLKNYPNLIRGILHQVKYYNLNKNNYNDNMRYKPVDDFFNEQIQSPIYIGNIIENNTNSPNTSFNFDFKQEQRDNNTQPNNDHYDNYNYSNSIRKIKYNEDRSNNIFFDKEMKPEKMIYIKKINKVGNNIKNMKNISPIKLRNSDKLDNNEINEDMYNNDSNRNMKNSSDNIYKNEYINENNHIYHIRNKISDIKKDNKMKDGLKEENVSSFIIYNDKKFLCDKLNHSIGHNFSINIGKMNNFNNLEINNCSTINYIGKKFRNKIKGQRYDKDGNLIFSNDDEVLKYIKHRIREEKDIEYNSNKMKYNYFILTKKFHGKLLYEIGLENNLNKINNILEKENVEIEHEPIMFIFKKDLNKLNNNEISNNTYTITNEYIRKLEQEKDKLNEEVEKLQKKINFEEKKSNKINDYEYDKLKEEVKKLNEKNKEKEKMLNEMNNILDEYSIKIKQYEEINNLIQTEKEKYEKYILELQEYNEKIIIEYQKMKSQLELELQKNTNKNNNIFNHEKLKINPAEYFDISIPTKKSKTEENQEKEDIISTPVLQDTNKEINNNNNIQKHEYITNSDIINRDIDNINNNDNIQIIDNIQYKNNQKEESMSRALQRIKNMRENRQKNKEDEVIKSEKISGMAQMLEKKLNENHDFK